MTRITYQFDANTPVPLTPVPSYARDLAQKILDMIKEVDDKWLTVTETDQRDLLMAVVDDIEKLCKEQIKEP